jgi:hypothetical protein
MEGIGSKELRRTGGQKSKEPQREMASLLMVLLALSAMLGLLDTSDEY